MGTTTAMVRKVVTIPLRGDGTLRLGVVADTHGRPHPDAVTHLRRLRPDAILHAGDIGEPEVLGLLGAVAPVFAVRGNIDGRAEGLPDLLLADLTGGESLRLRILVVHIAVAGPRLRGEVARLARAEGASLIVCGHSHVPFMGRARPHLFQSRFRRPPAIPSANFVRHHRCRARRGATGAPRL